MATDKEQCSDVEPIGYKLLSTESVNLIKLNCYI